MIEIGIMVTVEPERLKGPQGDQGERGPQESKDNPGPTGQKGDTGDGYIGPPGPAGPTGKEGSVPSGSVVFWSGVCPSGWDEHDISLPAWWDALWFPKEAPRFITKR